MSSSQTLRRPVRPRRSAPSSASDRQRAITSRRRRSIGVRSTVAAAARSGRRSRHRRARTRRCITGDRGSPRRSLRSLTLPPRAARRDSAGCRAARSSQSLGSAVTDRSRVAVSSSRAISVAARGSRNSRGEAPTSKPSIRIASRSPPTMLVRDLRAQRLCLLDLRPRRGRARSRRRAPGRSSRWHAGRRSRSRSGRLPLRRV